MTPTISKVKTAYKDYLWQKYGEDRREIDTLLSHIQEDNAGGLCFDDIDYASPIRSNWPAGQHIIRLLTLLGQCGREGLKNSPHATVVLGLIRHWLNNDYICPNWWWNDIGVPIRLSQIALLCEEILPKEEKPPLLIRIKRGTYLGIPEMESCFRDNWTDVPPCPTWTGANFLWGMTTSFAYGLLVNDPAITDAVRHEIECQFLRPSAEGVNPDHSFYQHGIRWYSGGYGRSFLVSVTPMIYAYLSASVAFSTEALDLFLSQFLDGARRFTHQGYYDIHAVGRELTRENALHVGELENAVSLLLNVPNLPRKAEMTAFLAEIKGEADPQNHTVFFPYISHLSHYYNGCYYGITGINQGETGAEHCNGEGVLCYHMTYGSKTCYLGNGTEYNNIDPLFDYAYVPGTTAFDETDGELLARDPRWRDFVCPDQRLACEAKGEGGILTQRVDHDGISYLSTFVVENGTLVAIGTDIHNPTGKPLHTTIDQTVAQDVKIDDCHTAHSGKFTYRALSGEGHFALTHRQGSLQRNSLESPPEPREGDVFCASLQDVKDHYAYAITPRNQANLAEILQNTPAFQAVRMPSGKIYVACHTHTTFTFNGKTVMGNPMECYIF